VPDTADETSSQSASDMSKKQRLFTNQSQIIKHTFKTNVFTTSARKYGPFSDMHCGGFET